MYSLPSTITIIEPRLSPTTLLPEKSSDNRADENVHSSSDEGSDVVIISGGNDATPILQRSTLSTTSSQLHPALLAEHAVPRKRVVCNKRTASFTSSTSVIKPTVLRPSVEGPDSDVGTVTFVESHVGYSGVTIESTGSSSLDLGPATRCILQPMVDGNEYACPYCGKKYKVKESCESHIKIHEGDENTCAVCGAVMSRQRDLKRHISKVHRHLLQPRSSCRQ